MNFRKAIPLLFLSSFIIQCAKVDTSLRPSDEITIYVYAEKVSPTTGYCYVDFRDPANNNDYHELEPDGIVTCGGVKTTRFYGGWRAYFDHPGNDPVRVSIIRPSTGSTLVRYGELQ